VADSDSQDRGAGVSIVIPSWNGLHLLRENLPSVESAANSYRRRVGGATEIIVVDDGSRDPTCRLLPAEFQTVELVRKEKNEGFAAACNAGFARCRYPIVALLNNDVRIEEDYFVHQAGHFRDPEVFAVTAKVYDWDEALFATGGRYGRFRRGFWSVFFNYDVNPEGSEWVEGRRLLSAYAIGGFSSYSREKLLALGGFNALLSPFHWEDVDLSYRGWKAGWEVRYEPRSLAHHRVSATIDAHYEQKTVDAVSTRNRLLFHWINLHSPRFLASHVFMLALLFLTRILVLDHRFYRSLWEALQLLGPARRLRAQEKKRAWRSDVQVARLLREFYRSAPIRVYYEHRQVLEHHPEAPRPASGRA
jgi:GT2 family glycosyltransferase